MLRFYKLWRVESCKSRGVTLSSFGKVVKDGFVNQQNRGFTESRGLLSVLRQSAALQKAAVLNPSVKPWSTWLFLYHFMDPL